MGPEGSAWAGSPAAAGRAPSLALRWCKMLTRPGPSSGAWATERRDLGESAVQAAPVPQLDTVSGRWGRRRGVTARPGRGGGPRHVTLLPGAARSGAVRAPVHVVVARPAAAHQGMRYCGAAGSPAPARRKRPSRAVCGPSLRAEAHSTRFWVM